MATTKTKTPRLNANDKSELLRFASLADEAREARAALDAAERALKTAEPSALRILTEKGPQILHGRTYSLGESVSLSTTGTDAELAEFARENGLKVSAPKPESCATATLRSAALKGLDCSAVCSITRTPIVVLT
jgi:hypothetical protein